MSAFGGKAEVFQNMAKSPLIAKSGSFVVQGQHKLVTASKWRTAKIVEDGYISFRGERPRKSIEKSPHWRAPKASGLENSVIFSIRHRKMKIDKTNSNAL